MATEVLFDLIRQRFDPSDRKVIATSLQHDPLVWQFVQVLDESLPIFKLADADPASLSPGALAVQLISRKQDVDLPNLGQIETALPHEVRQAAAKAFESTFNSGLPPADLATAGLLALALRERRKIKSGWAGIADEILIKRGHNALEKNIQIWQTPFACLYSLCPDFDSLTADFLRSKTNQTAQVGVGLLVHALLTNPLPDSARLDALFNPVSGLPMDLQLDALKWLDEAKQTQLCQSLAQSLMQVKSNVDAFARTFAEWEAFETPSSEDPLNKPVRFSLAEDLNRLAAFHHFLGDAAKSAETYRKAGDVLEFVKAQTLFQSAASRSTADAKSLWTTVIHALPHSQQARFGYIQNLIENQNLDEAKRLLAEMPPSTEKAWFEAELASDDAKPEKGPQLYSDFLKSTEQRTVSASKSYFVHRSNAGLSRKALKDLITNQGPAMGHLPIEPDYADPDQLQWLRDGFIQSRQYERAIELTAYLELVQPEDDGHKKTLARLYGQAKQWPQAYETIQQIVKSETTPALDDLTLFAESALRTDRADMAVSIAQNILKQSPNHAKALVLLGESFWQKGETVKAIQHMEKVVESIPEEADTWLALARIWQENGQSERALDVLQKGVVAVPNHPGLLRALGKLLLEKQSPSDAITYLQKAYAIDDQDPEGHFDLARASYQLGRYEQAWSLLTPYLTSYDQDAAIAKLLGHVMLAMDKEQEAKPILLFAAEQNPEDRNTTLSAAKIIIHEADTALKETDFATLTRLRSILQQSIGAHEGDSQLQLNLADVERLLGNSAQAFEIYRSLAEQERPGKAGPTWQLQYGLGKTALAMGRHEIALAALQDAATQQPGNLAVLHALTQAYLSSDLQSKADETARTALKMAPQDMQNILWYARLQMDQNQPEKAAKALKDSLVLITDQPVLKLWLARSLLSTGDLDAAERNLAELIEDPFTKGADLHQAAYACVQINNLDLAIKALESAISRTGTFNPLLALDLAAIFASRDEWLSALNVLDLTEDQTASFPEVALYKSDLLNHLGRYDSSLAVLESIQAQAEARLASDPGPTDSYTRSPLLYAVDFSLAGYDVRMGQLKRGLADLSEAVEWLEKAAAAKPDDVKIRLACAEAQAANLNFSRAAQLSSFDEAASQNPDRLDLACLKAELAYLTGDPLAAMQATEQIDSGLSTYPRLLALQSRMAAGMGDLEVAQNYLAEAQAAFDETYGQAEVTDLPVLFRQAMNLNGMAEAALALENAARAAADFEQADSLLPGQPLFNWRLALALTQAAEAQAKADLLAVRAHAPGAVFRAPDAYAAFNRCIALAKPTLDQQTWVCLKARGTAAFTGEWNLTTNLDPCLNDPEMGTAVVMNSDDDELIRKVLETYPDNADVLQAYGFNALRFNKVDGIPAVEKALELDTLNPLNHALLAFLNRSAPEMALRSIETALQIWPDEPEWHSFAADLQLQLGYAEQADAHIAEALKKNPDNPIFWQQSAEIRLHANDLAQAKADLEKSIQMQTKDAGAWLKLAEVNRRLGDMTAAIRDVQNAQQLEPGNKSLALKEAQLLFDQQDYPAAIEKTTAILETDPANTDARIIKARALAKQGKFEQALATLESSIKSQPDNAHLAVESLKIRKDFEGPEAVLPELIRLAEANTEDPEVLTLLTDWLIQTNRLEKAAQTAQTILRILPREAKVHLMLGRLQRKNGQLDQAIAHLSDAIAYDPNMVEAYIELGKTYQERRDLEEAIRAFQKGTEVAPKDPRPYYHAGMALKECKDYSGAEAMLKQAKHYAPGDGNIIRQLGMITAMNLINNLRETSQS